MDLIYFFNEYKASNNFLSLYYKFCKIVKLINQLKYSKRLQNKKVDRRYWIGITMPCRAGKYAGLGSVCPVKPPWSDDYN